MALGEFQLIERFFAQSHVRRPETILGVGDDCALLAVPAGMALAVTMDTLVEARHFPVDTDPCDVGYKALAVNLSDLAATGAQPAWATLSLSLPEADEAWLAAFSAGLFGLAQEHGVELVGGDTVRGPRVITLQLHGFVPPGAALTRKGARPGDLIYVSGTLGDGGAGLAVASGGLACAVADAAWLRGRLDRPTPRVSTGMALRGIATAAVDISDGLAADLGHILERSGVGARVELEALPLSAELLRAASSAQARQWALTAGDDYELCFTVPPEQAAAVAALPVLCTRIGVIEAATGLRIVNGQGQPVTLSATGHDHFSGQQ